MTEEKTEKVEKPVEKKDEITKEQIEALKKEIEEKESKTLEGVKRDITNAVKDDLAKEEQYKQLLKQNEELNKKIEEQQKVEQDKLEQIKKDFEQKLDDIKNEKQSVQTNENPFSIKTEDGEIKNYPVDINNPEVTKEIELESQKAFIEKYGLNESFGRPRV